MRAPEPQIKPSGCWRCMCQAPHLPAHPILLQGPCGEQHSVQPLPNPITSHPAGHIGDVQPKGDRQMSSWGPTGTLLLQVNIQALPVDPASACRSAQSLLPWWVFQQLSSQTDGPYRPDCQTEVAAQKGEHTREGLDEPRNQNSKL